MRNTITCIAISLLVITSPGVASTGDEPRGWLDTAWTHAKTTWETGNTELYLPFWTHHMRFGYDAEKIDQFNEFPAGLGLGKGRYNSNGNWESIYAMGFLDSRSNPSFMAGYAWAPTWEVGSDVKVGVGLTGFLMSRSNYWNGIPFPGVLPIASVTYKQLAVQAAYIPSTRRNDGNVLFVWGKWTFE